MAGALQNVVLLGKLGQLVPQSSDFQILVSTNRGSFRPIVPPRRPQQNWPTVRWSKNLLALSSIAVITKNFPLIDVTSLEAPHYRTDRNLNYGTIYPFPPKFTGKLTNAI